MRKPSKFIYRDIVNTYINTTRKYYKQKYTESYASKFVSPSAINKFKMHMHDIYHANTS
jgi:hypothetical protein